MDGEFSYIHTSLPLSASVQRWLRADSLEVQEMNKIFVTPPPTRSTSEKVRIDLFYHIRGAGAKKIKKRRE